MTPSRLPTDVWVRLADDEAPVQLPPWLPIPDPPRLPPEQRESANNPPEQVPGFLWEWRRRDGRWQGWVSYRRPIRHVGWISHRDWVDADRLIPRTAD